jgi:hypothetical protein
MALPVHVQCTLVAHGFTWRLLSGSYVKRFRIIAVARTYDFYPNITNSHADHDHVGVTNIETQGKAGIGVYSTALGTGLTRI